MLAKQTVIHGMKFIDWLQLTHTKHTSFWSNEYKVYTRNEAQIILTHWSLHLKSYCRNQCFETRVDPAGLTGSTGSGKKMGKKKPGFQKPD